MHGYNRSQLDWLYTDLKRATSVLKMAFVYSTKEFDCKFTLKRASKFQREGKCSKVVYDETSTRRSGNRKCTAS